MMQKRCFESTTKNPGELCKSHLEMPLYGPCLGRVTTNAEIGLDFTP